MTKRLPVSYEKTLNVLNDPAMMRQIHRSVEYFSKGGKGQTFEAVFGEPLIVPTPRRRSRRH